MRTLTLLSLLALAPSVLAQRAAESLEVTVIEVPVTVADRAGNAVRGLTAPNFEVSVDGKRVPIEYFETVDLARVTEAEAAKLPAAAYRNFLLLFDVANSTPVTTGRAQEAARQFVETQVGDRDLAAVATFTNEQGATMVTTFTRDKELLLAAIQSLGGAEHFKTIDALKLSANYTEQIGIKPPEGRRGESARVGANEQRRADLADINAEVNASFENERRTRIRTQLENFGAVARALDALHGQKQIVLLSEGFDAKLMMGRQDLSAKNTRKENDAVAHGELWEVDNEQRFGGAGQLGLVQAMIDVFRRSDVRLHAIDIKGIRTNVEASEGLQQSSNEGLFLITRPTGGTVFRNDNDLSSQFAQLLKQQEVIYVLGFKAREVRPGAFHPLKVKLTGGAKGEITHRTGYYDAQPNATDLEATLQYAELLQTRTSVRDLPLTIAAMPLPGLDEEARVLIVVDAAGEAFLDGITEPGATANLFVYAFGEKGKVQDSAQQRISLDLAKAGETVRATGVRYVASLHLPPGKYSVKAMMRVDQTDRVGLTTAQVEVPKYGETAVAAPVAVGPIGRWVTVISRAHGGEAASLLTVGEHPFIPLSRAEPGGEVALMLRGIDNPTITSSLVAADGTSTKVDVQLAGRTEPDEHNMTALLFRVPSQSIAPGEYELRFAVGATVVKLPLVVK